MKPKFFWLLLTRLVISRVAGGKATVFRESWYRDARLSPATPPGWVFAVVWPFNYATSSWAAAMFASKTTGAARIFGELKRPDWALNCLVLSWLLGIATAKKFRRTPPAGAWMIPLCLWLTLALALNAEFLARNPDRVSRSLGGVPTPT
jgi:benzodiazapine receptor